MPPRQTHCKNGHPFTPDNTHLTPQGHRRCITCLQGNREAGVWKGRTPGTTAKSAPVDIEALAAAALVIEEDPEGWIPQAACADIPKSMFFPARGNTVGLERAVSVCRSCPVRYECLAFGLGERQGVWGGTTELSRRRVRRQYREFQLGKVAA